MSEQTGLVELVTWAANREHEKYFNQTVEDKDVLLYEGKVVDLEQFQANPSKLKATQSFVDVASFTEYVKRYFEPSTILLASLANARVVANLDYHGQTGGKPSGASPRWNHHSATLVSKRTPEWTAFTAAAGKWLSQIEFAEFLEEWNHVVIEPEAAAITEVALNLVGAVNAKFSATVNRSNGSFVFGYQEDVDTGQARVPTAIKIAVQPFYHSELVDVLVRLRYRMKDYKPVFQIAIDNAERVEYDALTATFKAVEAALGEPVLVGP